MGWLYGIGELAFTAGFALVLLSLGLVLVGLAAMFVATEVLG